MLKGKIKRFLENDSLSPNEIVIANFIIKNYGPNLAYISIKNLAKSCYVSTSSITRFCKKINLPGYKGFINIISRENYTNSDYADVLSNDIQSIIRTKNIIQNEKLDLIAKLIFKVGKVKIFASGFAKYLAMNLARQLNKINIKTKIGDSSDIANIFPDKEIILFISFSGNNSSFLQVIKKINSFKEDSKMFSITSTSHCSIKKYVLEHIHGSVYTDAVIIEEKELPTISSRITHYILDKLFEKIYDKDSKKHDDLMKSIK